MWTTGYGPHGGRSHLDLFYLFFTFFLFKKTLEIIEGSIKNGQSRDTGNIKTHD